MFIYTLHRCDRIACSINAVSNSTLRSVSITFVSVVFVIACIECTRYILHDVLIISMLCEFDRDQSAPTDT